MTPRRAAALGALVLLLLVGLAPPASAHASLVSSDPVNGARLDASPRRVLLEFTERVEMALGGVRVFDADGERVDRGRITHPGGDGSAVELSLPKLDDGAYVVTWRFISADSHPVQGALSFVVGDAEAASAGDVEQLLGAGGGRALGVAYGVGRGVGFAAMFALLGGVAFVLLVWPEGVGNSRFRRLVVGSLGLLALASLLNLVFQGGYGAGLGLGDAFSWSVLDGVLGTRFGEVYLGRFVLLVFAAMLVAVLLRRASLPSWWRWAAFVIGLGIAATPGLAGHAAIGSHEPYALIADVVHVSAASVWIGGIVMLLAVLLPTAPYDQATASLAKFSRVATYAVVVLVATGAFQAYRQVGTIDALRSTDYGKFLTVKTALVAGVLAVAYLSRRITRQRWSPDAPRMLRRTVGLEAVIAVGVLAATSLLVNAVPAKVLAAAPQSGELTSTTMLLDYTVEPGRVGANTIHLYALTKAGQPQDVVEMTLRFTLPDRGVGPLPVKLQNAGPGHFQALRFDLPLRGRWRMDISARTSDIDQETFTGTVEIR